jgi:hypothetical protein
MSILLRAEVAFGFHRLAALRTDGAAAVGNFIAPRGKLMRLPPRAPEADDRRSIFIIAFHHDLACVDDDPVVVGVVAEAHFSGAEGWIHGRMDAHFFFIVFRRRDGEVWFLVGNLGQHLFDANREGLELDLLDDHSDRLWIRLAPGLEVEDAFSGLADGVDRDVADRVEVQFESGHGLPGERARHLDIFRTDRARFARNVGQRDEGEVTPLHADHDIGRAGEDGFHGFDAEAGG